MYNYFLGVNLLGIKDIFIKKYLGLKVGRNIPGSMVLKFSDKINIADEFKKYDKLLIRGARLLDGIETLIFNYSNNTIEIKYNPVLNDRLVFAWAEIIIDTLIKNMDYIKINWEYNIQSVVNKIEKELQIKKQQLKK